LKAAVNTRYGPPDVVSVMEVQKPVPRNNQVLVKVFASTCNRTDCGFRSAQYFISRLFTGLFKPRFKTLGNEFGGQVEETGKDVTLFRKGDRVFGYNDRNCGAHAEYMVIGEKEGIALMPRNTSYEEAAAITEGAHYALCDLRAAKVTAGQKILVNGGTGGIGSAAIQLAKYFGCHVTAVCATPHLALVRSLGADMAIDYKNQDFTVLNEKFDLVFDAVGKSSFAKCRSILKEKGKYISTELGKNAENVFLALAAPLKRNQKVLFPIPHISKKDVELLGSLVEKGHYKPLIDRHYSLTQIVEAYNYVESGHKTGNVIITIATFNDKS
jgi:NADPH:quinone reductase-like Zn-dependent oxidoreductase